MEKIRYAIVRVDMSCPFLCENYFCCFDFKECDFSKCKNKKNVGDTKEDFEQKIETAITRIIQRKNIVIKYKNFDISMTIKNLSKTIAEYLGVK